MRLLTKIAFCAAAIVSISAHNVSAQFKVAPDKYVVKFTDKNNNKYSLDKPNEFLTQKALDRRRKFNISLDNTDLPVNPKYVDSLRALGFKIQGVSKWHNCAIITVEDESQLQKLNNISFINLNYKWFEGRDTVKGYTPTVAIKRPKIKKKSKLSSNNVYNYGRGENQAYMLNINKLHNEGYNGKGMTIAVLDAGFYKVNQLNCFKKMINDGHLLGVRDFVDLDSNVYDSDNHGMNVLSCITGNWSGNLVGTAPEANAYLFRTEISSSENIVEEFLWAVAAEVADSLGVDMIHSSLGYQDFDDKSVNYPYNYINGNTTIASVAADRAASKGILVTVSAGNEGDDPNYPWITSPSDADSVLAVGAVDKNGKIAYFSSRGFSYDGRVKPDVCAQGVASAVQGPSNHITTSNGTSFAGPILAGAVLCLMQACPNAPINEVLNAVRASGDSYNKPSKEYGYGIPNFEVALKILQKKGY